MPLAQSLRKPIRATSNRGWLSFAAVAMLCFVGCERPQSPFANCSIQGIDISRHQGEIDWSKVADAGIRFAWIKATEGGDYLDPAFRRNWLLARAAGVRRGAYHFVYWCRKAEDQAAWFVGNVPADPDALPPVLDVEWNPGSRSCPNKVSREKALADMQVILDAMERTYGRRPFIYAPADFFADVMQGALDDYPLWIRGVQGRQPDEYGDRLWQVWQHTDKGSVPGIKGDVDRDCADAQRAFWLKFP